MFSAIARLLAAFYALWPSYAFAIVALTATVYAVLMPLTLHQGRAMAGMQRVQPELRALRQRHKDDRQRLNQETMALYQRHGVNPASGCLPMLVQMPVMIVMYRVIRGLAYHDPTTGVAAPRYLDHGSSLYQSLRDHGGRMVSGGIDLSTSALSPHGSALAAIPFFALAGLVVAASVWQQRLTLNRTAPSSDRAPGQGLMRVMPAFTGFLAVSLPAGVTVYYLASSLFRIGQQHLIRRHHPPASLDVPHPDAGTTANGTARIGPGPSPAPRDPAERRATRTRKRHNAKRRKRARRR